MPLPPSPIPPEAVYEISSQLQMLVEAQRATEIATLTAAIVSAMNRPVALGEVMDIRRDVAFTLYNQRNAGKNSDWLTQRADTLAAAYT